LRGDRHATGEVDLRHEAEDGDQRGEEGDMGEVAFHGRLSALRRCRWLADAAPRAQGFCHAVRIVERGKRGRDEESPAGTAGRAGRPGLGQAGLTVEKDRFSAFIQGSSDLDQSLFAGALVARQRYLPGLIADPVGPTFQAVWDPVLIGALFVLPCDETNTLLSS